MSINSLNYPTIQPTLTLDFARTKRLDPRITFTRASAGTYVDAEGVIQTAPENVPRFDHDPLTGESLGLLVEEQRTNLVLQSEDFSSASWPLTNVQAFGSGSAVNTAVAPDGATTADKIVETTSNSLHYVQQIITGATDGATYTLSVHAKAAERSSIEILDAYALKGRTFNLSNGTSSPAQTGAGAPLAYSITYLGSGWYRCSISLAASGTSISHRISISNESTTFYTGDGTSGLYLWGAQLEPGAFPTSYIPTTTAAATRSADVASIEGAAFSSWYRQDEGTVFAEAASTSSLALDSSGAAIGVACFSDGTNSELIRFGALGASVIYIDGGTTQASLSSGTLVAASRFKIASSAKVNDFAFARDSGSVQSDTSGTMPTLSQLELARSGVGSGLFTGAISRLTFWPQRLPSTTLESITA